MSIAKKLKDAVLGTAPTAQEPTEQQRLDAAVSARDVALSQLRARREELSALSTVAAQANDDAALERLFVEDGKADFKIRALTNANKEDMDRADALDRAAKRQAEEAAFAQLTTETRTNLDRLLTSVDTIVRTDETARVAKIARVHALEDTDENVIELKRQAALLGVPVPEFAQRSPSSSAEIRMVTTAYDLRTASIRPNERHSFDQKYLDDLCAAAGCHNFRTAISESAYPLAARLADLRADPAKYAAICGRISDKHNADMAAARKAHEEAENARAVKEYEAQYGAH